MKILKKKWYLLLFFMFAILAVLFMISPQYRVGLFVDIHGDQLEKKILAENPNHGNSTSTVTAPIVPSYMGIRSFHLWEGDHDIVEFSLFAFGFGSETAYYGCYYSFDDTPVPFQNIPVGLNKLGNDCIWFGEGDNWGITRRIKENW